MQVFVPPSQGKRRIEKGARKKGIVIANQGNYLQRTYAADYIGFAVLVTCYLLVSLPRIDMATLS